MTTDPLDSTQHLALDQDCYVNEEIKEAARDLLKKYREKSGRKGPE